MSLFKFEKAQKGDKVWSIKYGWGKIYAIYPRNIYPIKVNFETNNKKSILRDFDLDGKESSDAINSSIFWNEFEIPKEAFKKPLPVLETEYKKQGYWYVDHTQNECSVFDFDTDKGFKNIESIEKYIRKQCIKTAKEILKYNQAKG